MGMMRNNDLDDLFAEAVKVVCQYDKASSSLIQRRLSIGYARAARIMDQLEAKRVVSQSDGTSIPREVLIKDAEEFLKNIPITDLPPQEVVSFNNQKYTPKKASFLPKEFTDLENPKEMILGYDDKKKSVKARFEEIGNLLIVGSPISKKDELIESFLISTLSNFTPKDLSLIIYGSTYSFIKYGKIPHLLSPIIDNWEKAISALRWSMAEVDRRFKLRAEGSKEKFSEIYFVYNFDFTDIEREDALKRLTSMAYKAGIHLIILADQLADLPKSVRDNVPVRLTFDKFGEYKATYEFKEITSVTTIAIKSSEVDKYLTEI